MYGRIFDYKYQERRVPYIKGTAGKIKEFTGTSAGNFENFRTSYRNIP